MTDSVERPQDGQHEVPLQDTRGEALPDPVETEQAIQQLRAAGFSDDQQAALTTALLRVMALWTQQATRGDLHAEHQALAQRLAQQLDARMRTCVGTSATTPTRCARSCATRSRSTQRCSTRRAPSPHAGGTCCCG
jgi:hypothetical protein